MSEQSTRAFSRPAMRNHVIRLMLLGVIVVGFDAWCASLLSFLFALTWLSVGLSKKVRQQATGALLADAGLFIFVCFSLTVGHTLANASAHSPKASNIRRLHIISSELEQHQKEVGPIHPRCISDNQALPQLLSFRLNTAFDYDWLYFPPLAKGRPDAILMASPTAWLTTYHRPPETREKGYRTVLYRNGEVAWIPEPAYQAALRRQLLNGW